MKPIVRKLTLEMNGKVIPVKIVRERRMNVRVSINRTAAILRMPVYSDEQSEQEYLDFFKNWLIEQLKTKPKLQHFFNEKIYRDGDVIKVGDRSYHIRIQSQERAGHVGRKLPGNILELKMSDSDSADHIHKSIKHLLSRLIGADYLPEVTRRVMELNHLFFKQEIKEVRLKLNQRTWGSCSSTGAINLSTRLLFAPQEVIDYVIIHELAHRIEMNHSERFWTLVENAMPDYKEKEKWLKHYDHQCQF